MFAPPLQMRALHRGVEGGGVGGVAGDGEGDGAGVVEQRDHQHERLVAGVAREADEEVGGGAINAVINEGFGGVVKEATVTLGNVQGHGRLVVRGDVVAVEEQPYHRLLLRFDPQHKLGVSIEVFAIRVRLVPVPVHVLAAREARRAPARVDGGEEMAHSLPRNPKDAIILLLRSLLVETERLFQLGGPILFVVWRKIPLPPHVTPRVLEPYHPPPARLPHLQHSVCVLLCQPGTLLLLL
mmetsp:Transcript_70036/g.146015  ORF Transcript_70036/g.146015 Transcript_70036/m.146015 type:complete len:240 (+) Transcript_70036:416-1135(+)